MNNKPLTREQIHASLMNGTLYLKTAEGATASDSVSAAAPKNMDKLPEKVSFSSIAYSGAMIKQAWSYWPIVVDIDGCDAQLPLPALADHSNKCAASLGQHNTGDLTNHMVSTTGDIYPRYSPLAANIYNTAKQGQRWQLSIAGPIRSIEEVKDSEEINVNGKVFYGPLYVVRRMTLREITIVPVGADVNTVLTIK